MAELKGTINCSKILNFIIDFYISFLSCTYESKFKCCSENFSFAAFFLFLRMSNSSTYLGKFINKLSSKKDKNSDMSPPKYRHFKGEFSISEIQNFTGIIF